MIGILVFVFGTIIGSFLNVVGLRLNSGSTLQGRSLCFSCSKKLSWWELVPILSFILLRGRCSRCKSKISWQYLLVELWVGIIFVSLYWIFQETNILFILSTFIFSIYTVILVYDFKHKIIPNGLVYFSMIPALVFAFYSGYSFYDYSTGLLVFIFFGTLWILTRGRAVGLGDAKLGASIGFLLGFSKGLSALVLSFWIGSIVVLSYMFVQKIYGKKSLLREGKKLTMKSEIPFGPFLILAAWISLIFSLDLLHVAAF